MGKPVLQVACPPEDNSGIFWVPYIVLLSNIQKFLGHVIYLAQGLKIGGYKRVLLFHFIDEKTDARIGSVNCPALNVILRY